MSNYKSRVLKVFFSESYEDALFKYGIKAYEKDSKRFYHALKYLDFPEGKSIVEIGPYPGTGFYYFGENNVIIGLGKADKEFVSRVNLIGHQMIDVDFENFEISSSLKNISDITLVMEVLEHIRNPFQFLNQLVLTVKPGGKLYLTTNNFSYIGFLIKLILGKNILDNISSEGSYYPGHCRYYSLNELESYFKEAGFKVLKSNQTNFLPDFNYYKNPFFGILKNTFLGIVPKRFYTHIEILVQRI